MNRKKLIMIMVLTLCCFMFSTVFGFTPLTEKQLEELQKTVKDQVKNGSIKIIELSGFIQSIQMINKEIFFGKKPLSESSLEHSIYLNQQRDFVLEKLKTQEQMIKLLKLTEHFKELNTNDLMPFVQDLNKISEAIMTTKGLVNSSQ